MAMIETFPYGKAPFWLLVIAALSSLTRWAVGAGVHERADLVFVSNTPTQFETYKKVVPEFERRRHVRVQLQYASTAAIQTRLQSAMLAGAEVPDMVELVDGALGYFTKGPPEDIGLLDLTDRVKAARLDRRLVASRFSLWSSPDTIGDESGGRRI
jgi:hypothetical protein